MEVWPAVSHRILPELPLEVAGSLLCTGIAQWPDDGIQYVLFIYEDKSSAS
jgi:hypothetical protein